MEQSKLGTLKEMVEESLTNRPKQSLEAIQQYFDNIKNEPSITNIDELKDKLTEASYLKQFQEAITQTSIMVFVGAFKVSQNIIPVEFDQYIREFLFLARLDDKSIFDMRTFYLSNLDAEEMEIGNKLPAPLPDSEESAMTPEQRKEKVRADYDALINTLLTKYKERSIHLV